MTEHVYADEIVAPERKPSLWLLVRGSVGLFLGWIFSAVYFSIFLALSVLTLRRWSRSLVAPATHFWARVIFALAGVRVVLENESTLLGRRARIIVTNHPSTFDMVWGGLLLPPAGVPVAKREIIYLPGFNLMWWALRFERIDRTNAADARRTLVGLAERIREHRLSVVMAPEGTRSPDGTIQQFKKGAFHLAMQAGVPVFPVVISGAFDVWPRHRLVPIPGLLRIHHLPPVSTEGWRRDTLKEQIAAIREDMVAALTEMQKK